ncbi:MAG: IS1380 family transposase, partial [Stackebrandtia sp.]
MKGNKHRRRVVVSADGAGVVSHAGVGLLREMAEYTGLVGAVTDALMGTYRGVPIHPPGRVFTDLAVAVADGADAISGMSVLGDREDLHGPVASMPTTWRVLDRVDADHLGKVREARASARVAAWAAGAGPDLTAELRLDFDATITIAHSEKENAAATWKRTFGFHPLLCFLDRPDIAGGEALAGLLRPGNAGSNTATDHITVLDMAIAGLPEHARPVFDPDTGTWTGPRVLARSDSAGATHGFAAACVERGVGFSFGFPVDARIQRIVDAIPEACWHPAIQTDGDVREGAWVAEATGMIDLSSWPQGSRLILRKERPHPGAQLTFTDADGHRITAILTNTEPGLVSGQAPGLELRHRQHARVEDRIREAKATGLRNLPCRAWNENAAWLEVVLTAVDLVCWTKQVCFADVPELARCEIAAFRYRV